MADKTSSSFEDAWREWSKVLGGLDAAALTLLRAAFEAGAAAAEKSPAEKFGRKGGLIGGKVRASSLTPERRKEIAQQAAKSRWEKTSSGSVGEN